MWLMRSLSGAPPTDGTLVRRVSARSYRDVYARLRKYAQCIKYRL